MMLAGRMVGGACVIAAALACGSDGGGDAWMGEVVDSGGVRVIVSRGAGLWGDEPPAIEEVLRFGSLSGGGPDEFGKVVALDVDASGRIHVLDQQAREVRVFDAEGRHLRTLGGPGAGPGELSASVLGVFVAPDGTVGVPDIGNTRITRFGADGAAIASIPIRLEHGVPIRWDATMDGALVAQLRHVPGATMAPGEVGSTARDPLVRIPIQALEGRSFTDTLASVPTGTSVTAGPDGVPRIGLFMPEPIWDLSESGTLVTAMNSEYRVDVHGSDGILSHVLVLAGERRAVTEAEKTRIRRLVGEMMADQGLPPAMVERITRETTFADTYPALAGVLARPNGEVWVQRVRTLDETASGEAADFDPQDLGDRRWDVFEPGGRYMGVLTLPERFALMKVVGDRVFGVLRDSLDVQHVVGVRVRTR